ncbi:segregation and condensation protein B [Thermoplasmatales archaeon BRNA1]|nr:segregation and condensation protein B [Thermoplasmatales archaeon BRNA1]
MRDKTAVEAALFAATAPLTVADIVERTGLPEADVRYALKDLRMEYDMRDSAIIISATGGEYRMMLRPEYQKYTDLFARPEMPPGVMRTLSAIAYNQPVLQSKLVKARGPRAYEDVARLIEMGYVYSRPSGPTYELTTTKKFSEDFGIGSTRKEDIRKWIEKMSTGNYTPKKTNVPDEESDTESE